MSYLALALFLKECYLYSIFLTVFGKVIPSILLFLHGIIPITAEFVTLVAYAQFTKFDSCGLRVIQFDGFDFDWGTVELKYHYVGSFIDENSFEQLTVS